MKIHDGLKYFVTVVMLFVFVCSSAQSKLKIAPMNPHYINFIEEKNAGSLSMAAPSPYLLNFENFFKQKKIKSPGVYPLVYDMRTAGPGGSSLLTSVKHQLSCGACWAFASYSSIESNWKINGLGEFDLSENNLKNCHGFDLDPCEWGHHFMSTAYFVRGSGPITEEDDPYQPENSFCVENLTPTAFIPESRYLPEDHNAFKSAIMTTGAVYNTYRSEGASYEWINDHLTYCYQGGNTTTHAIAIVGWNDTITTGCGEGAWICKNEYGESFGEDGFFYIAYQDTLVLKYNSTWPIREEYDPGLTIYDYDSVGGWPFVGYEDSIAYGLIKFQAESDQFISRVGTYTVSFGSYLKAEIYSEFDGENLSGLISSTAEKYCDNPGFWILDLEESFSIYEGEEFYILMKYNSPGIDFPIAAEGQDEGYTNAHLETGKCWSREENGPWEAWGADTDFKYDICIKAYGHNLTKLELKVFLEGPFNGGLMNSDLISSGDFPLIQPYSAEPWNYTGTESISEISSEFVDWVLVELRQTNGDAASADGSSIIGVKAAILKNDGSIVSTDGSPLLEFKVKVNENLFAVIYHRNHLPVMSAVSLEEVDDIYSYNFSTDITKAYGGSSGHKEIGSGKYGMISGDSQSNGVIDESDLLNWQSQAGKKSYNPNDYNLNNEVNNSDKNDFWLPNKNSASQIPD